MRTIASLETDRAEELLVWLKKEQIPVEVRPTRQKNGLETCEILVEEEYFARACNVVETWNAEQRQLRKNQSGIRIVSALFVSALLLGLISPKLGAACFGLLMDSIFLYVAWKAVRTGVINAAPLADWTPEIQRFTNSFGFWWRVTLCLLMVVAFSLMILVGLAKL